MQKFIQLFAIMAMIFLSSSNIAVAAGGEYFIDGSQISLIWGIPFAGMLLSIALFPILAEDFWHHHFGKISLLWAVTILAPMLYVMGFQVTMGSFAHAMLLEYFPFIILLLALYTVSGGIHLSGKIVGTPRVNVGFLLIGTLLASVMGTTGAAMVLIRPLLNANRFRKHRTHIVIFFIFLVANIGGSLTPLGDPPLFLGFLNGVDFFWTTKNMLAPMLACVVVLIGVFYIMDKILYEREENHPTKEQEEHDGDAISIQGLQNVLLLLFIVGMVLMSGMWKPGINFTILGNEVKLQNLVRDIALLAVAIYSFKFTDQAPRKANEFNWFPIEEVGKLFFGIFITIIPVIAILQHGENGALRDLVALVSDEAGNPDNVMYFWLTGILSSFLDNAPTYLVFFNTAGGDAEILMNQMTNTLLAISAGAVFMGANSYIGNAPNFMVRAIAIQNDVKMPSFFGYMLWSGIILTPIFVLVTFIFF